MKSIACTIQYGQSVIDYHLSFLNRKSLEIAVYPDKRIVVKAPATSSMAAIEAKIKKRAHWIKKQIAYFNQFEPRTPVRQYLGGESHRYLGRQYRLKIERAERNRILLKNGYFYIESTENHPLHIQALLNEWYKQKAKIYLVKIFDECWNIFNKKGLEKPFLKIQAMEKRWGSLSPKKQLTLNLRLIQASKECIEYVIAHELCHLVHPNHGSDFYNLLEQTMPDWLRRKHKLELSLI